ncbi:ABC transporter substrate-binding protein [Sporolactobacillus shoreicorticis]|uniref:ABC transporter substrate-binding protein n=1 Tax=Sporolactobacillus shoreicorticis TaxID=1923877 RepID=A0ABW5SAP2_9BACL|nr:ABC transporter substrate-binding protein [Sporolactobacillus shoreicorticis]MCO7125462.1 ABC transporter substrate-binding protein [Sporolactobacillus shoreicorticis]
MKKLYLFAVFILAAALTLSGCQPHAGTGDGKNGSKASKKIIIAEPVHLIAYLPLYVAIDKGFFKDEGLDVEVTTATGGAHVTSLVSGDVWGNIGGPESNQMANKGSKDPIVSVVNVVNRANVYLMANKKYKLKDDSDAGLKSFMKGKTIAAGRYGGSPNLLTRWLLMKVGLDSKKDVKLEEPADASAVVSLVAQGKADLANGAEPQINEGIKKGAWSEPFYGFPSLGDYAYSVISVKKSAIKNEPKTVQKFVTAMLKGLKVVNEDKDEAFKILKKEFPTASNDSLKASMDRAYKDSLWSKDGIISKDAVAKPMEVVKKTGIYTKGYDYNKLVNMSFVEEASK